MNLSMPGQQTAVCARSFLVTTRTPGLLHDETKGRDMDDYFLMSREWREVRMKVLERDGAKCACCGATARDGAKMNVDHIKPRIRYPELALSTNNLQVLCNACNHGKGNKFETDWRAPSSGSTRHAPSMVRELIQCLALQPELARRIHVPQPDDGTPEGAALTALVGFCTSASGSLSTPSTMQHFADTPHERVLASALASAHDQGVTSEQAEVELRRSVERYCQTHGNGRSIAVCAAADNAAQQDGERLRQLDMVRRSIKGESLD